MSKKLTQDQFDDLCWAAQGLNKAIEGTWHRVDEHPYIKSLHRKIEKLKAELDARLEKEEDNLLD